MTEKNERMEQVEDWLRLIERTRLFCNTTDELGRLVGFSVGNRNSLARKGGSSLFMKEAIFHQLAYLCEEQTGLDLQHVIEAYQDVDNFMDRYEAKLRDRTLLSELVTLYYGNGEPSQDLSFVQNRLEEQHIPILILVLTGCLPRLSAKNGDVVNIEDDFQRVFAFLRGVCGVPIFMTIPVLTMEEQRFADSPDSHTRLQMIAAMTHVLNSYGGLSTQLRLSVNTREFLKDQYIPDIDGIWTEDDASTAFWYFERMVNGYSMYHYTMKDNQQTLRYTKYFISFYSEYSSPMAIVAHPDLVRYTVEGKPVPSGVFAYLDFEQAKDELRFAPNSKDGEWFSVSQLIRSKHANFFESLLCDGSKNVVNEFAQDEYELLQMMVAITNDYIYLKQGEQSYYQVPKSLNEVLEDIHFGDNVGILSFADATYIAFDDKSLYYNVTTEDSMNEHGIRIVHAITE